MISKTIVRTKWLTYWANNFIFARIQLSTYEFKNDMAIIKIICNTYHPTPISNGPVNYVTFPKWWYQIALPIHPILLYINVGNLEISWRVDSNFPKDEL